MTDPPVTFEVSVEEVKRLAGERVIDAEIANYALRREIARLQQENDTLRASLQAHLGSEPVRLLTTEEEPTEPVEAT